jgi:hypothetical protein
MEAQLVPVSPPPGGVYRLAGPYEPFAPPPWSAAGPDGTFGNRFDDPTAVDGNPPEDRFRTIYCATQREAAFGETLARFRPALNLISRIQHIEDDHEPLEEVGEGVVDPEDPKRGLVHADWRLKRQMGHTVLVPGLTFVDIAAAASVQHLRAALASIATRLDLTDIDLSSLTSQQRLFTQRCARYIYDQKDDRGHPEFAGIRYYSRLNTDWECWAIFDDRIRHARGWPTLPTTPFPDDEDLLRVGKLFNLTFETLPGQNHYVRP